MYSFAKLKQIQYIYSLPIIFYFELCLVELSLFFFFIFLFVLKFRERKKQLSNSWKFEADMIEEPRPEFKKWDMEVIKNESLKQISLADQIEAVKNRTELSGIEIVANASID